MKKKMCIKDGVWYCELAGECVPQRVPVQITMHMWTLMHSLHNQGPRTQLFVKSKAHQLTDLQKMLEQKDSIFKNEKEKLPDTNL